MIDLPRIGLRVVVFGILVSGAPLMSLPQGSTPSFTLTISAPESVIANSAINIEMKITNTSEAALTLNTSYYGNLPVGYNYIVRSQKGDLISSSPCFLQGAKGVDLKLPCGAVGSARTGYLRPGETWATMARLTEKYSFDRPGRYTIQVSRQEPGMPIVYSNILTLVVLPKP
jgi:hypothetical protein